MAGKKERLMEKWEYDILFVKHFEEKSHDYNQRYRNLYVFCV